MHKVAGIFNKKKTIIIILEKFNNNIRACLLYVAHPISYSRICVVHCCILLYKCIHCNKAYTTMK